MISSLLSWNRWRAGKNWTADPTSDWIHNCSAISLAKGCAAPKGDHFTLQEKIAGTTCELTAHTCFPVPLLDTPYGHLRSAACMKGVWSWSSGLAPSQQLSFIQFYKWVNWGMDFPGSSAGKESACNAGDPGSIPGSGRSLGEGIGYSLQYSWTSWWLS